MGTFVDMTRLLASTRNNYTCEISNFMHNKTTGTAKINIRIKTEKRKVD